MEEEIEELKNRVKKNEEGEKKAERMEKEVVSRRGGRIKKKVKKIERWREMKQKERRQRNVITKELEVEKKSIRKEIGKLWKGIAKQEQIEEVRDVNRRGEVEWKMVVVQIKYLDGKKEVMRRRGELKGKRKRMDWTREERKMQWRLEELAREEKKRGRYAMVRYAKIWMKRSGGDRSRREENWEMDEEQNGGEKKRKGGRGKMESSRAREGRKPEKIRERNR